MTPLIIMIYPGSDNEFTSVIPTTLIKERPFGILTQVSISCDQISICLKGILRHPNGELVGVAGVVGGLDVEDHVVVVEIVLASRKRPGGRNRNFTELLFHDRLDLLRRTLLDLMWPPTMRSNPKLDIRMVR